MKHNNIIKISVMAVFILTLLVHPAIAQDKYILSSSPTLKIEGGSTLHDWDMTSNEAKGEGVFLVEGNQLRSISSLTVTMKAETLKSGTRGLDNNAYKALNTKNHPEIKFSLKEISGSGTNFSATGDFTIAGVTKTASIPVKVSQSGNSFTFEGKHKTKLTAFSIDPPTALLGTVKTEDDITISFKSTFQKQ